MALSLDFTGVNVSDMDPLYSGHYWAATCLDMNNNEDYTKDPRIGEWPNVLFLG